MKKDLNLEIIKNQLIKNNAMPSKDFGQNFLKDELIINKVIEGSNIQDKDVVEIGPGLGALTNHLVKIAKSLVAYEIDISMYKIISETIRASNFKILNKNFLEVDFLWEGKKSIVSNIPYNITSKILFKIFENISKFDSATIMMQKEVGERILASAKEKNYGKISVTSQLLANVSKICHVPSSAFFPEPKVDSIVIKFDFHQDFFDKNLFDFVKKCFLNQRKTLWNNVKNFVPQKDFLRLCEILKIKEKTRPQELTPKKFLEIYKHLYN